MMTLDMWSRQIAALCATSAESAEPAAGTYPHRVLVYLRQSGSQQSQSDIRQALDIGHPAAVWALLRLRHLGLIECSRDDPRNGRYLRYRAL